MKYLYTQKVFTFTRFVFAQDHRYGSSVFGYAIGTNTFSNAYVTDVSSGAKDYYAFFRS